jgi:hypothetical protein
VQALPQRFEWQHDRIKIQVGLAGSFDQLLKLGAARFQRFKYGGLDMLWPDMCESRQTGFLKQGIVVQGLT